MSQPHVEQVNTDEEEGWRDLLAVLDRVPFVSGLKRDIASLASLVYERRAPRLVVIGADHARRDALAIELLGAPSAKDNAWNVIEDEGRTVEWAGVDADFDLRPLLDARVPDVVVVLANDAEATQGLGHHFESLTRALQPHDDHTPQGMILLQDGTTAGRDATREQLDEASLKTCPIHVDSRELSEAIVPALPESAQVEGARAFPLAVSSRRSVASSVVRCCSTLAITVAITPLPLSDIAVLAPLQAMMVTTLAYLSGREWDRKTASEWVASVGVVGGAGLGMRWGAQQIVKLVPGMGSIASAAIAGAGTLAVGRSALKYFLDETDL